MIKINYINLHVVLGAVQGALDSAGGRAINEFHKGFALGFLLTVIAGLLTSLIKSPSESSAPFVISVMITSLVGSTTYRVLQGSAVFFAARRGHYPTGPTGYLTGSITGLLALGLLLAFRDSRTRDRPRHRASNNVF
jgi:hypothetical protein